MKKLLAIVLALTFVISVTPVFAEDDNSAILGRATTSIKVNDTSTIYENGVLYTRWFNNPFPEDATDESGAPLVPLPVFQITSNGAVSTEAAAPYYQWQVKGNPTFYKIPLPKLAKGQKLEEFNLHYSSSTYQGATVPLKFPGEGWESKGYTSSSSQITTIAHKTNYTKYLACADASKDKTYVETSSGDRTRVNITKYAQECIEAGQAYMYVGMYNWGTTSNVYGYQNSNGYWPTISFRMTGDFSETENVPNANVYCITKSGTVAYAKQNLKTSVALFKLPLPEIGANQKIVKYNLNFCSLNNSLSIGYSFGAFKMPDGESYISDNKGLPGGTDDATATKAFYNQYSTTGIKDAYLYNCGNNSNKKTAHLATYVNETAKEGDSHIYVAVTVREGSSVSINSDKAITVDYEVIDTTAHPKTLTINELKLVGNSVNPYNASNIEQLEPTKKYKAVIKASNYGDAPKNVKLYIATYSNNELDSLTPVNCTINAYNSDFMFWNEVVAPDAGKTVKVFLLDNDGITPLTKNKEASVPAAVSE